MRALEYQDGGTELLILIDRMVECVIQLYSDQCIYLSGERDPPTSLPVR